MLVLTLRKGSSIFIEPDITIRLNEHSLLEYVELTFEAPPSRAIIREDAKSKARRHNGRFYKVVE